jgi:hypothetical protein
VAEIAERACIGAPYMREAVTRACEEAVKDYASRLKAVLKERSKGEYATWGFVAMFMDMIDEEMK